MRIYRRLGTRRKRERLLSFDRIDSDAVARFEIADCPKGSKDSRGRGRRCGCNKREVEQAENAKGLIRAEKDEGEPYDGPEEGKERDDDNRLEGRDGWLSFGDACIIVYAT